MKIRIKSGSLTVLNSREVKKIRELVESQFGFFPGKEYAFLVNEKDKLFVVNKDLDNIALENLRVNKVGLYFGQIKPAQIRLSKEGAAFLVDLANREGVKLRNLVELKSKEVETYFEGKDLHKDLGDQNTLIILQYGSDTLGCAQYKGGTILNFLPKIHRGTVII